MSIIEICVIIITVFLVITALSVIALAIAGIKLFKKAKTLIKKPTQLVSDVSDTANDIFSRFKEDAKGISHAVGNIKDSAEHIAYIIKKEVTSGVFTLGHFAKGIMKYIHKRKKRKKKK